MLYNLISCSPIFDVPNNNRDAKIELETTFFDVYTPPSFEEPVTSSRRVWIRRFRRAALAA